MEKKMRRRKACLHLVIFPILTIILFFTLNGMSSDEIHVHFDPRPNEPPYQPINPYPPDGAINVDIPVTLRVYVYDPSSKTVDVYFYYALDDSLIGIDYNVSTTESIATVQWKGLQYGKSYSWYVVVNDSEYENTSQIWSFATISKPPLPPSIPLNIEPVANITGPNTGYTNETLVFYAYHSYDPDGDIVGYRWDFNNDGVFDTDWQKDVFISYKYSYPGNYTVKLQVKDNDGATAIDLHTINITQLELYKRLPVARANGPYQGFIHENISFSSTGSYDPDGTIVNYTWDFGDGNVSYMKNPIHSYAKAGNYIVILKVTDNDNLSNIDITIAHINIPPEKVPPEKEERWPTLAIIVVAVTSIIAIILVYKRYKFDRHKGKKR